jgi:hypothetical protein
MLDSQLEIVQQAKQFLSDISEQDYSSTVKPHLSGSAGVHMRHILDHYNALMVGHEIGLVDYNKRNRFSSVEVDPAAALEQWSLIEAWLADACALPGETIIQVLSETSIEHTEYAQVPSTLARELVFVSSHAIHHFSLLAVLRSLQGKPAADNFGIAPATATFLRQQA